MARTGQVALKVCRADAAAAAAAAREAAALGALGPGAPSVARLLGAFEDRGRAVLVLEPHREDLRACYKRCRRRRDAPSLGGVPVPLARAAAAGLGAALAHAHGAGVAHLDVKPDNALVDAARARVVLGAGQESEIPNFKGSFLGRVVLADFGSARTSGEPPLDSAYVASRYYRAPETCLGLGHPAFPADVWALGVTLAEAATGKLLFTGRDNHALLLAHAARLGPPPPRTFAAARFAAKHLLPGGALRARPAAEGAAAAADDAAAPRPLAAVLAGSGATTRAAGELLDLVEAALRWDPARRLDAAAAAASRFARGA
ncbi:hypothetical protein AURANDRAFT_67537 [Aureococcus anophagefferens]|uniref:Protein kinase domain-containing protein n=1 Tax=Aureococcus anophagefferens TaxID=44056 RepID=F0YLI0_AURAN|nr:hypothetical protein AURANDRAFT_67537 [Aureococcus anophagefferens]EGB03981.1 hypothetical protein AURANDRAFT_67537 [Aureococcus anophagefferens]|eukprot:XP_009041259.1 hypothetical protein AURANDRAFT_67537 [Aureococcus anophagefferens]